MPGDSVAPHGPIEKGQVNLTFAELPRTRLRVYPLVTRFAERLQAFTHPREKQTRVKDRVNLALLLTFHLPAGESTLTVRSTSPPYGTHEVPLDFALRWVS